MSKKPTPRRSLFEAKVPNHPELNKHPGVLEIRCAELEEHAAKGTLLTNNPNLTQHHIACAMESLYRAFKSLSRDLPHERMSVVHGIFLSQAEFTRHRLVPAFYGAYLQDRVRLDLGAGYWRIEATYLRALQVIQDELDFTRRLSHPIKVPKTERARLIERYLQALEHYMVDTWNFLEDIRFTLPGRDSARDVAEELKGVIWDTETTDIS